MQFRIPQPSDRLATGSVAGGPTTSSLLMYRAFTVVFLLGTPTSYVVEVNAKSAGFNIQTRAVLIFGVYIFFTLCILPLSLVSESHCHGVPVARCTARTIRLQGGYFEAPLTVSIGPYIPENDYGVGVQTGVVHA